jgi:hypothetical protein
MAISLADAELDVPTAVTLGKMMVLWPHC